MGGIPAAGPGRLVQFDGARHVGKQFQSGGGIERVELAGVGTDVDRSAPFALVSGDKVRVAGAVASGRRRRTRMLSLPGILHGPDPQSAYAPVLWSRGRGFHGRTRTRDRNRRAR